MPKLRYLKAILAGEQKDEQCEKDRVAIIAKIKLFLISDKERIKQEISDRLRKNFPKDDDNFKAQEIVLTEFLNETVKEIIISGDDEKVQRFLEIYRNDKTFLGTAYPQYISNGPGSRLVVLANHTGVGLFTEKERNAIKLGMASSLGH